MQWWTDFIAWLSSDNGRSVLSDALIPFFAILVAAVLGTLIGRSGMKQLVSQRDRETRANAVLALIAAGHNASQWHSQSATAREHAERLSLDADATLRLLPVSGADVAADWATHQLADMRAHSVSFSYQAEHTMDEYRERLVLWLHKPNKARKLFAADLERWAYQSGEVDPLLSEQQRWVERQSTAAESRPAQAEHVSQPALAPEDQPILPPPSGNAEKP